MRKKLLAVLLASTMIMQPLSAVGATEFGDGRQSEVVFEFEDEESLDAGQEFEAEPEAETTGADVKTGKPSEDAIQMGDDVWFTYDASTSTGTISGTGAMWDYLKDGRTLDNQHENPFKNQIDKNIDTLIIEGGVTHVGDYLLCEMGHGIKKIILKTGIQSIGKYTFYNIWSLQDVVMEEGIQEIGEYGFYNCWGLKEIIFPNSLKKIGYSCFSGCQKLEKILFSTSLSEIPDCCFSDCKSLTNVDIPNNIMRIGDSAFNNCSGLETIDLSEGLSEIGAWAFDGCSRLNNVTIPGTVKTLVHHTFGNCLSLSNITLSEGLKNMYTHVFDGCIRLQEITIPQSVVDITQMSNIEDTFWGCENLIKIKGYTCSAAKQYYNSLSDERKTKITFESIGEGTHKWESNKSVIEEPTCTEKGLKAQQCSICGAINEESEEEIPAYGHDWNGGVITKEPTETEDGVRTYTCWRCNGTKDEPIPKLSTEWPIKVGDNITALLENDTLILTGNGSTYDYDMPSWGINGVEWMKWTSDNSLSQIKKIIVEEGITRIGNCVFAGCTNLQNIVLPKTLQEIGEHSFVDCKSLKEFSISEGVTSIGEGIFYGCSTLEKISFPSTLKEIPCFSNKFEGLPNLKIVELAEGIEKIGDGAFCHHMNLKTINLPSTITEIGEYSFDYSGFVEISIPSNIKKITTRAFEGDTNLKYVNLAEGITSIEDGAFRNCTQLQYISIPESVINIDPLAFEGCPNFYIKGKVGSYAEKYANDYMIPFRSGDYKVTFKNNGRTIMTIYVNGGQDATPPTLTSRPGYTLSWDGDYTNIQEDMVINAVWTKISSDIPPVIITPPEPDPETKKYTVTFVDRGKVVKTEKVESGEAAEYPFITRTGYNLSWDKDFSNVTGDITVNAVWTVITPGKVTNLTAEVGKETINLSWDRAENADYYMVYRKIVSDQNFEAVEKLSSIFWTDKDIVTGTEYQYKVVAVCSLEGIKYQGEDSVIVTAKIGTPQIGDTYTVGNLNYKVTGDKKVEVLGIAKVTDTLTIPSSVIISGKSYKVTSIQSKAFYRNEDIVNVTIGNNVTYVGKYSFYRCPNLETVKFGKRVETISTGAFSLCPNLEDVTLPASVKSLGAKAFYHCGSLKTMTIKSSKLTYIGKKGLAVSSRTVVKVPNSKYSTYKKLITKSGTYKTLKIQKM